MAKENTALQEIEKLQEQIEAKRQQAIEELREERKGLVSQVADVDKQLAALSGGKIRKTGQRVCAVCGQAGHNARRHTKEEIAAARKRKEEE